MSTKALTKKEAITYLEISEKEFDNYFKSGKEFNGYKESNRWKFKVSELTKWKKLKSTRIVKLNRKEYQECFEFAVKMAYSGKGSAGTGIRGVRSEVQMADDFILGILAEYGVRKFLLTKFNFEIKLDMEVHPSHITPQDVDGIVENGKVRPANLGVAVKSSKWKNCWNIIPPLEYEDNNRKSDVYIFVRVGLPSDHIFRVFNNHALLKNVNSFLNKSEAFRKIEKLDEIPIWITGFSYHQELKKVTEIPGQKFDGKVKHRYVANVGSMRNKDSDWKKVIEQI